MGDFELDFLPRLVDHSGQLGVWACVTTYGQNPVRLLYSLGLLVESFLAQLVLQL